MSPAVHKLFVPGTTQKALTLTRRAGIGGGSCGLTCTCMTTHYTHVLHIHLLTEVVGCVWWGAYGCCGNLYLYVVIYPAWIGTRSFINFVLRVVVTLSSPQY